MRLILDASVTIAFIADDERSEYADAAISACGTDRAVVPLLWQWEMTNSLLVLERKGRLVDAAAAYAKIVRELPIDVATDESEARRLAEIAIARRHGLSGYDSAYLALATWMGLPLATIDTKLARAAVAENVFYGG